MFKINEMLKIRKFKIIMRTVFILLGLFIASFIFVTHLRGALLMSETPAGTSTEFKTATATEIKTEPPAESETATAAKSEEEFSFICSVCGISTLHGHADASAVKEVKEEKPGGFMGIMAAAASLNDPSALNNFTKGIVIKDTAGNVIDPATGTVTLGNNYILSISFQEKSNLQFAYAVNGFLTYELPSSIAVHTAVNNAPIIGTGPSNPVIGRYSITTGGIVTVKFENVYADGRPAPGNFIDVYTDAVFRLDLLSAFSNSGEFIGFDFGNNISINITVEESEPYPEIEKSVTNYNPATNIINYTVSVTAKDGNLPVDMLSDWARAAGMNIGASPYNYINLSAVSVSLNGSPVSSSAYSISWRAGSNPPTFDIIFSGGIIIPQNQVLAVTYSINLSDFIMQYYGNSNLNFRVNNEATVTYKDPNGNPQTKKATSNVSVSKTFISKSGTYAANSSDSTGMTGTITWTVNIGDGGVNLAGKTITDTLGTGFTSAHRPANVSISGLASLGGSVLWTESVSTSRPGSGNDFSFVVPSDQGEVKYITATYGIDINMADSSYPAGGTFSNSVIINLPNNPQAYTYITVTKPGAFGNSNIKKTVKYLDENTLQYTIKINVPAYMAGKIFYLQDHLDLMSSSYGVHNVPTDMVITFNGIKYEQGEAPYKWWLLPSGSYDSSYWYMVFGVDPDPETGKVSRNNTELWPSDITGDTEIVITYTVPLSAPFPGSSWSYYFTTYEGKDNLGDLLRSTASPGFDLRNNINVYGENSYGSSTTVGSANVRMNWPIFKNIDPNRPVVDGNTLEYEVVLNPSSTSYTNSSYGNQRTVFELFKAGGPAIFFDEYDDRLEYVKGSFAAYIYSYASEPVSNKLRSTYKYASGDVTENGNSFTADLTELTRISGIDDLGANWYTATKFSDSSNYSIVIRYKLQVKEDTLKTLTNPIELTNTAGIIANSETHNGTFTNDSTVKFGEKPVSKKMSLSGNIATFNIVINPYGLQFDGGGNLLVKDKMNNTLSFYLTSIKAYTGSGLSSSQSLTQTTTLDPNTAWTWAVTDENEITLVIPDKMPVKIVYDALIKGGQNDTVNVNNYVEVSGGYYDLYNVSWKIQDTSASGSGSREKLWLYKNDSVRTDIFLPDAEFALYIGWPGDDWADNPYGGLDEPVPPAGIPLKRTDIVSGMTFYYLDDNITSGPNGRIEFDDGWLTPSHGAIYAVAELKAPDGYIPPVDNITLFSYRPHGNLGSRPVKTVTDYIMISNQPLETDVTIPVEKIIRGEPSGTPRNFTFNLLQVTDDTGLMAEFPGYNDTAVISGAGSTAFVIENLTPGIYYYRISEEPNPDSGDVDWRYDDTAYIIKVEVTADKNVDPVDLKYTVTNLTKKGAGVVFTNIYGAAYDFEFKKLQGSGSKPLEGAVFTLYSDDTCATEEDEAASNVNGIVKFTEISAGIYYMKETTTPKNYGKNDIIYIVSINSDGSFAIAVYHGGVKPAELLEHDGEHYIVRNYLAIKLPETGGVVGMLSLASIGLAVSLTALGAFAYRQRKASLLKNMRR